MALNNAIIMQNDNGTTTTIKVDTAAINNNTPISISNTGVASFSGGINAASLPNSGVVAGTYTNSTVVVDAKGRVTSATSGAGGGNIEKATLTKSFSAGEAASLTLSEPITTSPLVTAIKEVPQVGILSKESWDVATNGANYDRHNSAYNNDLQILSTLTSSLATTTFDSSATFTTDINGSNINDFVFNATGTKIYICNPNFGYIHTFSLSTPYDTNTFTHDGFVDIYFNSDFNLLPSAMEWNTAGTRIFIRNGLNENVAQFNVTTAFDVSTIVGLTTAYTQLSMPNIGRKFVFNSVGTKFYYHNAGGGVLQQFNLSTAFDISTATFDVGPGGAEGGFDTNSSFSSIPNSIDFQFDSFVFKENGSKLLLGYQNVFNFGSFIAELNLTTPFNIHTASHTGIFVDITEAHTENQTQFNQFMGFVFNADESQLYIGSFDKIYKFNYGADENNQFLITPAQFDNDDVGKQIEGNGGIAILKNVQGNFKTIVPFNNTNTISAGNWEMYALKFNPQTGVKSSGIVTVQDISFATSANTEFSGDSNIGSNIGYFAFNDTGSKLFVYNVNSSLLDEYQTASNFNIASSVYQGSSAGNLLLQGFEFSSDGQFIFTREGNIIFKIALQIPFSIIGADVRNTFDGGENVVEQFDFGNIFFLNGAITLRDFVFNDTGTKLFLLDDSLQFNPPAYFYEVNLTAPFTLTGIQQASFNSHIPESNEVDYDLDVREPQSNQFAHAMSFADEGRLLYFSMRDDSSGTSIYFIKEYKFTTAYDSNTAQATGKIFNLSNFAFGGFPDDIRFNNNSTKMYVLEGPSFQPGTIREYNTNLFGIIQPANGLYSTAITNAGGQIDTAFWIDISAMIADENIGGGAIAYAISKDNRITWRVIDDSLGERIIARFNSGAWQVNHATTYAATSFLNAVVNEEHAAIQEALGLGGAAGVFNTMHSTQLEAITDANHFVLDNTLDLVIAIKITAPTIDVPSSDGIAINYDAETLNRGAVLGIDYEWDFPNSTTLRITSNFAQNLKIRVI